MLGLGCRVHRVLDVGFGVKARDPRNYDNLVTLDVVHKQHLGTGWGRTKVTSWMVKWVRVQGVGR